MAQLFSPRAALCTAAVMCGFGALAAGRLPAGLLSNLGSERPPAAGPSLGFQERTPSPAPKSEPISHAYPGGALDVDCSHVGQGLGGPGYQFIATCPGRADAPNGRWAVERKTGEAGGVSLVDADGEFLDDLPQLMDGMPFVLFWSPRSDWFFVNHYQGSTMEQLRVFQIVNRQVIERSAIFAEAGTIMVERNPCLVRPRSGRVYASGWRWSRDGRRIGFVAYTHPAACLVTDEERVSSFGEAIDSLWMSGEVATGRIDPESIRVRPDGVGDMPTEGAYEGF